MKKMVMALALAASFAAQAEILDRPTGFQIGTRMTLRPYVSFSYVYDTNPDSTHNQDTKSGSSWVVSPGTSLEYKGDNWSLVGAIYYQYHAYSNYANNRNQHSYGENLSFNWSDAKADEKGWSLMLTESYQQINEDDDMMNDNGRGVGRDRKQFQFAAQLGRRWTERFHTAINASYYWLDYNNKYARYAPMYGWTRWTVGAEAGYALSRWTDLIVAGSYQGYTQDNDTAIYSSQASNGEWAGNSSRGTTVQFGIGSYATEKITYRALVGWSYYRYNDHSENAPTYSVSAQWKISDTWSTMFLASRFYQPSETSYGSSQLTDTVSWGIAHSMIRGKLTTSFDIAYRRNNQTYSVVSSSKYSQDILTGRLAINYTINRFLGVFASGEYQTCGYDYEVTNAANGDYNRWRLTIGFRLTY